MAYQAGGERWPARFDTLAVSRKCLVMEAAFRPMDMGDLHSLLAADPGPVPKITALKLMAALGSSPGRGSAEWKEDLASVIPAESDLASGSSEDVQRQESLRQRAELLVSPACAHTVRLPISDLLARLNALDAWARSRAPFVHSLAELSRQIGTLRDTVDPLVATSFSWHGLRRVIS